MPPSTHCSALRSLSTKERARVSVFSNTLVHVKGRLKVPAPCGRCACRVVGTLRRGGSKQFGCAKGRRPA